MAFEEALRTQSVQTSADLSASRFCGVNLDNTGKLALPSAGGAGIGVLQDKPNAANVAGCVGISGTTKMIVGAGQTVTAGDLVTVDSAGKAKTAGSGDYIWGRARSTGTAAVVISVLLDIGNAKA